MFKRYEATIRNTHCCIKYVMNLITIKFYIGRPLPGTAYLHLGCAASSSVDLMIVDDTTESGVSVHGCHLQLVVRVILICAEK